MKAQSNNIRSNHHGVTGITLTCPLPAGRRSTGQALVEYSLILALIAVVCIAVLTSIGQECRQKLELVEEAIAK
jgi:Flp pilus assembly pilin Flp